jgi:hypothetical protein
VRIIYLIEEGALWSGGQEAKADKLKQERDAARAERDKAKARRPVATRSPLLEGAGEAGSSAAAAVAPSSSSTELARVAATADASGSGDGRVRGRRSVDDLVADYVDARCVGI